MKKKHIVEDLDKVHEVTGAEKGEIAFIQINSEIMKMIERAKEEMILN